MRIALVIEHFDPAWGGAERNLHEVARLLADRGHEVSIFCASGWKRWVGPERAIHVLRWGGRTRSAIGLWRFSRWVQSRLRRDAFDVSLSVTMAVPATVLQPLGGTVRQTLARNAAVCATPLSRSLKRLSNILSPKRRAMLWLERRTMRHRRVRFVAALSDYVVEQLRDGYGLSDERIALIRNAVETPTVTAEDRAAWREQVRRAFRIPESSCVYVFAAFNPRLKGAAQLLAALAELRRRGVDAIVLLAGAIGYPEQELSVRLGVRDRVRIVGTTQRMVRLYCAADVTVLPTFHDPSSRVVIESLALGTPAITTRFNGAGDLLRREDGRWCGRLIDDPHDVKALAQAMAELADPDTRRGCAEATAGLAGSLTMARHVDELEALLARAVTGDG